jgi:hypothetical protein
MAHDSQELTITSGAWGDDAAHWLAKALASATLAELQKQWERGASLFRIHCGSELVGAFLLRVDQTGQGPQGVIVAAAAELAGVDMIASCMPAIEAMFQGVRSIRYHTQQPALARKMARIGYRAQELICVKEIA